MQKILFTILAISLLTMAACSRESASTDKAVATVAAPEAAKECVLTPPDEPGVCTMDWNPVCGCDGVTYGNACGAKAAGVPHFTQGACEEERAD